MYIDIHNMAKTIMVSNEVYEELKTIKNNRSFSETLKNLLDRNYVKLGFGLRECLGILNKDKEWKEIDINLKKRWQRWSKKYV